MMRPVLAGLAVAAMSGCMMEPVPAPLPTDAEGSDVPVLGSVTGFVAGDPTLWETLDYSVGAPDASVAILSDGERTELTIEAFPAGTNGQRAGRIEMRATLPNGPVPGPAGTTVIVLHDGDGVDGPQYQSTGVPLVNVTALTRTDGLYGAATGTFVATLCRVGEPDAPPDLSDCVDLAAEFETGLQFKSS